MTWQRARRPEQKAERTESILEAAESLSSEKAIDLITLDAIAKKAGLTKSNLYRYFGSKEAIFSSLYLIAFTDWIAALEKALAPYAGTDDWEAAAAEITDTLAEGTRLSRLASPPADRLRVSRDPVSLAESSRSLTDLTRRAQTALHATLVSISADQATHLVRHILALIAGLGSTQSAATDYGKPPREQAPETRNGVLLRELHAALRPLLRGYLFVARLNS